MRNLVTALRQSTCPKCGSEYVVRSHRNLFEQVVSALGIFPYRCDACGKRFALLGARRSRPIEKGASPHGRKQL
jgi:DNA-directed RNA polymerase subunit RPC12/RpoP